VRLAGWTFEALDGAARTRVTFDGSSETPVVLLEVFGSDHRLVEQVVAGDIRQGLDNLQLVLNWLAARDRTLPSPNQEAGD
jgi:hypothetical protein